MVAGPGKRRLEIELIEDRARRHTTFTKRRQGLIKKTKVFANKFDAQAAVIAFSGAGNLFAFGSPSVESVVRRYLDTASGGGGAEEEEERPQTPEERIGAALEKGSWDAVVEGLGPLEIDELSTEIMKLRRVVAARVSEMEARD
ncbi:hypothetical protein CASFOL_036766 [Castilleja foliolosa]|uniref:MADS-box domain-containing protein n=1 Tax=Castilleja foliolosa TaxID=1961234 RepID=A0ABD3BQC7_9LAMI